MSRGGRTREPASLREALRFFAEPDSALPFVVELRWPEGIECPGCSGRRHSFLYTRRIWKCLNAACRRQFSVKVGTLMEDSPIGLDTWLPCLWMVANSERLSSYQVHRALGVTQKTAWFMLRRIRRARDVAEPDPPDELSELERMKGLARAVLSVQATRR